MKLGITIATLTIGAFAAAALSGPALAQGSDGKPAPRVAASLPQSATPSRGHTSGGDNTRAAQPQTAPARVAAPSK